MTNSRVISKFQPKILRGGVVIQRRCPGRSDSPDGLGNSGRSSGGRRERQGRERAPAPADDVGVAARGSNKMDEKRPRDWRRVPVLSLDWTTMTNDGKLSKCFTSETKRFHNK